MNAIEHQLEIMTVDSTSLSNALVGADGRLKEKVEIGNGIKLFPLFTSFRRAGAVGGNEVFAFLIEIPVGVISHFIAMAIYEWITKHGIRRVRANGVEVKITDVPSESIPAI